MQRIESMRLTRCAEHASSICAQGLRLALYKGLHATAARLVQKGGCRTGSDNRALRVKLTKMLNIAGVAHRSAIFGLKADSAGPRDSSHPVRAFPLWRQLVMVLGGRGAPKNKVAFLEASGFNFAAMVATQSLLVARGSHSSLKTILLKEQRVIFTQPLLLKLIISKHSR